MTAMACCDDHIHRCIPIPPREEVHGNISTAQHHSPLSERDLSYGSINATQLQPTLRELRVQSFIQCRRFHSVLYPSEKTHIPNVKLRCKMSRCQCSIWCKLELSLERLYLAHLRQAAMFKAFAQFGSGLGVMTASLGGVDGHNRKMKLCILAMPLLGSLLEGPLQ